MSAPMTPCAVCHTRPAHWWADCHAWVGPNGWSCDRWAYPVCALCAATGGPIELEFGTNPSAVPSAATLADGSTRLPPGWRQDDESRIWQQWWPVGRWQLRPV